MKASTFLASASILLTPCLAAPAVAQTLPPPQPDYRWTVHNYTITYTSPGFAYNFNVTGKYVSSTYPSFPGFIAGCSGTDNAVFSNCYLYQYTLEPGSSDNPTVSAKMNQVRDSSPQSNLVIRLHETVGDDGYPHTYNAYHPTPVEDKKKFQVKPHEAKSDGKNSD